MAYSLPAAAASPNAARGVPRLAMLDQERGPGADVVVVGVAVGVGVEATGTPPLVVLRIVPFSPTAQAVVALTAEMPQIAPEAPVDCAVQVMPPSVVLWILSVPRGPMTHTVLASIAST